MNFHWLGLNNQGKTCSGDTSATSAAELRQILLSNGVVLLKSKESKSFKFTNLSYELIYLFSSLSLLLSSGIHLMEALNLLSLKPALKKIKNNIQYVIKELKTGHSFHIALSTQNDVFSSMIIQVIRVGEASGALSRVCSQISDYLIMKNEFSKKIRRSLLMPTITFIVSITLVLIIFIFIIPRFELILGSTNKPLPKITQIIFDISHNITMYVVGFITIVTLPILLVNNEWFRDFKDRIIFKVPFLGKLFHLTDLIRFIRSFSILHSCGMPIISSLEYSKEVIKNRYFRDKVIQLTSLINKGSSVEYSMKSIGDYYFPSELIAIISISERSGDLVSMLDKSCLIFEKDLEAALDIMVTVVNPAVMIFLGLFISILMVSIYLPIFGIATSLS